MKKGKALRAQSGKLEEQTLPKSINHSAAKYPSLPGVEGAPAPPARKTRARNLTRSSCGKERKRHQSLSPESRIDELIDRGLG